MTPAVSVVLPTYNGATRGFLGEAIDSVISQSDADFELLIVDDGSTDATEQFCARYLTDPRIRYVRKANGGLASARNAGIREARAELICFLDDDDVWKPHKLAMQRKAFAAASVKPGLLYSAIEVIDSAGNPLYMQYHETPADVYRALFYENVVDAPSSVMVSARALREVGNFNADIFPAKLQGCEDRELWSRIAKRFPVLSTSEALVRYRMHSFKMSNTPDRMENSELTMLAAALASAPEHIVADSARIYGAAHVRFALGRFTIGDYSGFAHEFRRARSYGPVPLGLWGRYLLTIFPPAIPLLRRILSSMRIVEPAKSSRRPA